MRNSFLLVSIGAVVCLLVNPGNFGTIDTTRRLQTERWLRLGEPPVSPAGPDFGITGKDGLRHAWYGIGQSLVLMPFDAVSDVIMPEVARALSIPDGKQRLLRETFVSLTMQTALTALMLLLAVRVLGSFGFSAGLQAAGALSLLLGTTVLAYIQSAQENLLLLTLALCALWGIRRWQAEDRLAWAGLAGAACGFAVLVRLPSVLEAAVFGAFACVAGVQRRRFLFAFAPPIAVALALDRWYHWARFGEWTSTYMGIFGRQNHFNPFSYPFWQGFRDTFFSLDKSVLLYDPLLVVLAVAVWFGRRKLSRDLRLMLATLGALLLLYAAAYAKYFVFGGGVGWAHRFTTLPVHLLCLFSVPLLLRDGPRRLSLAIVGLAIVLQAASTALPPNVEVMQRERAPDHSVVVNRAANLWQLATGTEDPARFAGIPAEWSSLNYLPFQLRFRFPSLARPAIVAWLVLLACLPLLSLAALRAAFAAAADEHVEAGQGEQRQQQRG